MSVNTYRYAYGWTTLNAALTDGGNAAHAALDWWTTNHTTPAYAAHRILVAIDNTTWATKTEVATHLNLGITDLEEDQPYGRALAAADRHQLAAWTNIRSTPMLAITPAAYNLIHPDDPDSAAKTQAMFTTSLNTPDPASQAPQTTGRPQVANAFPRITHLRSNSSAPNDILTAASIPREVRPTR